MQTEQQTAHTPLPWHEAGSAVWSEDRQVASCCYSGNRFDGDCAIKMPRTVGEVEANAELIVRAVNSHADLVKAGHRLLDAIADLGDAAREEIDESAVEAMIAAIAKAQG